MSDAAKAMDNVPDSIMRSSVRVRAWMKTNNVRALSGLHRWSESEAFFPAVTELLHAINNRPVHYSHSLHPGGPSLLTEEEVHLNDAAEKVRRAIEEET